MKMKCVCRICDAVGNLSEDDLSHPVTRTACRECGMILFINPDTGKVDAHKSPMKDSPAFETSGEGSSADPGPVISMRPKGREAKDRTAVLVVAIILLALIAAGIYLTIILDIV